MANVPGNDGDNHADLDFEFKQVRCNARDLAETVQAILQNAADTFQDASVVLDAVFYHLRAFRLTDNDDFLVVYPEYTPENSDENPDDGGK